jgi:SAM-dependent methyltransferase
MQTNSTIATYDQYAQIYDQEVIDFWANFPEAFIDKYISLLPGKRVLNLGSGSGRDALLLRDRGLEVVCLDASKAMVEITNNLGFESHLATFAELGFPKESFDGIWAYTSLIHIPKDEAKEVIKNIRTLLKPDGVFAIGVIQGETASMVERKTMPGAARYFKNYTSEELKAFIEPLGFTFQYEQNYQPHNSIYVNQLYGAQAKQ